MTNMYKISVNGIICEAPSLEEAIKMAQALNLSEAKTTKKQQPKKGTGAKAPEATEPKTEGKVVNSKKGISVKMDIVEGQGKGAGKQYVKLTFGEKPSQTVRDQMKLHHFKFFHVDNTWSAYKTDKSVAFAQSLIK